MGWQRRAQVLAIKERVRRRDGKRCVVCQIDEQSHEKRYGQTFDVHRIVPRSEYSTEQGVCVTVCEVCHDAIEGKGHWGWIAKDHRVDQEGVATQVRLSSRRDLDEEENWRKHEAWGAWVKTLRLAKLGTLRARSMARFAMLSDLSPKTLLDFEAGRREPLLFEAKRLSTALGITLDELATEKVADDGWRPLCEERSHRRALVLRAREPQEGEIEALSREAKLVWDEMGRAAEKREAARKADVPPPPKRLRGH
jgi:transcriptional regulator with XRE-family HTH domain